MTGLGYEQTKSTSLWYVSFPPESGSHLARNRDDPRKRTFDNRLTSESGRIPPARLMTAYDPERKFDRTNIVKLSLR